MKKYPDFHPDIFKMGYIIVYMTDYSLLANQITRRQLKAGFSDEASQIVHVEISGGGEHSINIAPPFSKLVKITKKHAGRYAYLLRYKNDDYERRGRYKVAYFSATLCNTGYDIRGLLRFLYKWIGQSNRFWFCSEGALWSLQMEYPEALNYLKPEDCMPAHFLASPQLETVWAGKIPSCLKSGATVRSPTSSRFLLYLAMPDFVCG